MVTAAMTDLLLHPLGIYVLALGAGFLIPLFDRAHRGSAILVFLLALTCLESSTVPLPSISRPLASSRRFLSTCASACSKAVSYLR